MKIRLLKMELKKSFTNKFFLISILILCLISFLSAFYSIEVFIENTDMFRAVQPDGKFGKNYMFQTLSAYGGWIGGETRSLMQAAFFMFIPAAGVLPFGTSLLMERKIGYLRNIAIRTKKSSYYFAKTIACFLSAFTVVVVPLILNFLLVTTILPSSLPHINYEIYYLVYFSEPFSDVFYSNPIFFVILYILIDGVFAGLISLLGLCLSFRMKNRYLVLFLPFLFFIALDYFANFILFNVDGNVWGYEFSLINLLHASSTRGEKQWWMISIHCLILLVSTLPFIAVRSKFDEIY